MADAASDEMAQMWKMIQHEHGPNTRQIIDAAKGWEQVNELLVRTQQGVLEQVGQLKLASLDPVGSEQGSQAIKFLIEDVRAWLGRVAIIANNIAIIPGRLRKLASDIDRTYVAVGYDHVLFFDYYEYVMDISKSIVPDSLQPVQFVFERYALVWDTRRWMKDLAERFLVLRTIVKSTVEDGTASRANPDGRVSRKIHIKDTTYLRDFATNVEDIRRHFTLTDNRFLSIDFDPSALENSAELAKEHRSLLDGMAHYLTGFDQTLEFWALFADQAKDLMEANELRGEELIRGTLAAVPMLPPQDADKVAPQFSPPGR